MKLLLDEMLDRHIAFQLRQRGHDVVALQELPDRWGTPDRDLLVDLAYRDDRVLVTDNVRDFLPLHRDLAAGGEPHAGLLLAASSKFPRHKRAIGRWVAALDAYLTALPAGPSLADSFDWL